MSFDAYLWFKFIHFAGFISWMAMLFYLPRLYVYHSENSQNADFVKVVKKMEKMLFNAIGWIALIVTLFSGLVIVIFVKPELMKMGYFHLKLTCAILMIAYHFWLFYYLKKFEKDECKKSGKYFRALNEVPTVIMLAILYAMLIMPFKG